MRIDRETMEGFRGYLQERECAGATEGKYLHDVGALAEFCGGEIELTRQDYGRLVRTAGRAGDERLACFPQTIYMCISTLG